MTHPFSEHNVAASPVPTGKWVDLSEQISACGRLLRSWIAQHNEFALVSEAELSLLWACGAAPPGGLSQKELADALVVSPPHVSGLVEQLRQKGLLRGRRAANDRRKRHWQLTPQGRAELETMLNRLSDWAAELHQRAPDLPDQLAELVNQLASIRAGRDASGTSPSTADEHRETKSSVRRGQKRGAA